jgi:hypothetical protein
MIRVAPPHSQRLPSCIELHVADINALVGPMLTSVSTSGRIPDETVAATTLLWSSLVQAIRPSPLVPRAVFGLKPE